MANHAVRIASLTLTLVYMAALFIVSSIPDRVGSGNVLSVVPSLFQNLMHIPAFGVLSLLWIRTFKAYYYLDRTSVFASAGIVILYGAGLEVYQASVPGRFSSAMDLVLNFAGVVLFTSFYYILKRNNG